MTILNEKYIALTTFKRDGEGRSTPVWIAAGPDGTGVFTTAGSSWKARRLGNDDRFTAQPCNVKGVPTPGSDIVTGHAALVTGAQFTPVLAAVKAKYGVQVTMTQALGKLRARFSDHEPSDTGVILTFDAPVA